MSEFIMCNINDLVLVVLGLILLWVGIDITTFLGLIFAGTGGFLAGWGGTGILLNLLGG